MDDVTRHPDDATLFDLVEEALEPARAEQVRAHLARCSACAAFVQAARAGAPVTSSAVEELPAEAAAKLQAAMTSAWRERMAAIAASESAQDASAPGGEFAGFAPTDSSATQADAAPEPEPASAPAPASTPPRRRGRRLVPVLAFVVLGTLAGTSVLLGDETAKQASIDRDSGAESDNSPMAGSAPEATDIQEPALAPSAGAPSAMEDPTGELDGDDEIRDGDAASPAAGASGDAAGTPPADLGARPVGDAETTDADGALSDAAKAARETSGSTGGAPGATNDTAVTSVPPPADYEAFVDQDRVCIATLDETRLELPDGRIPTQITPGPFGLFLVCG